MVVYYSSIAAGCLLLGVDVSWCIQSGSIDLLQGGCVSIKEFMV
jgi:hypothetical protein